jgi:uncharacterized membrane protein YphA (DoxX/SURF4 family)
MQRTLDRWVDPKGIALGRILVALASFALIVEWWIPLVRLSTGEFVRVPVSTWIPAATPAFVQGLVSVGLIGAVLLLLGTLARVGAALVCLTSAFALVLDEQVYSNHLYLLVWMAGLLAMSRCGNAFAFPRRKSREPVPYWPVFLIKLQISVVYFWTGVSKMNEQYLSGEVLQTFINGWVPIPDAAFSYMALLSIGAEIFLSIALWIPRLVPLATALGAGLHLGIIILLQDPWPLIFFALLMAAGYVQFLTSRPQQLMKGSSVDARPIQSETARLE